VGSVGVRGLWKSFGKVEVLRNVDLEVPTGSLTAVLGPSGCGKTTLLRMIAGFDQPDAGTISLNGQVVFERGRSTPPERRHVGYVAQEGALFPHLNVEANLLYGLSRFGRGNREQGRDRAIELLELVGLEENLRTRFPHQLSGGQQQRVALARALASKPELVLLDEPFSSLDAGLREGMRRAVAQALAQAGATAILVTHDQSEAFSMADQLIVMHEGRIAQCGAPVEVYRTPVSLSVGTFLGEANVLPGVIHGAMVDCVLGRLPLRQAISVSDGPANVLVRPEQVILTRDESLVHGRIAKITFYGQQTKVLVQLQDSSALISSIVLGPFAAPDDGEIAIGVQGEVMAYPEMPPAFSSTGSAAEKETTV
jgi:iron(III) transport system ATP-binding protein